MSGPGRHRMHPALDSVALRVHCPRPQSSVDAPLSNAIEMTEGTAVLRRGCSYQLEPRPLGLEGHQGPEEMGQGLGLRGF